jgi:hypothetical protein
MSRQVPGRRDQPRPIKRPKPRGLGKGRIPTATTRYVEANVKPKPELSPAEKAHAAATFCRRLPLS